MLTNFAALTPKQKIVWSRDVWSAARDQMFIKNFIGTGENALIQRITELTKTEKGEKVLMHLVADLVEDGVIGDNEREGNEEAMQSYSQEITIDLLTHSVRNKGKLAEQKTVINFRKMGKDRLAFWLANRCDQLAFLTMAGIGYGFTAETIAEFRSAGVDGGAGIIAVGVIRHVSARSHARGGGNARVAKTITIPVKIKAGSQRRNDAVNLKANHRRAGYSLNP